MKTKCAAGAVAVLFTAFLSGNLFAAAIVLSPDAGTPRVVGENKQTIAFVARLDEAPAGNVVLTVTSGAPGAATVSPAELTFSNTTWNTAQEVIIRGVNDGDTTNEALTVFVAVDPAKSDDAFDSAPTQAIAVAVMDDEAPTTSPGPSNVLVVYNANWPYDADNDGVNDSLQVARYYLEKRGVPSVNMLGLDCSVGTRHYYTEAECNTNWSTVFYPEVVSPVWNKIGQLGQTNVKCILLCYGVPYLMYRSGAGEKLRSVDNALVSIEDMYDSPDVNPLIENSAVPNYFYGATKPTFEPDMAHFSHALHTRSGKTVYLVGRLDGPSGPAVDDYGSLQKSVELVDQCLYADKYAGTNSAAQYFTGIAYVDTQYSIGFDRYTHSLVAADTNVHSGAYNTWEHADRNIGYGARFLEEAGFALKWENTSGNNRIGTGSAKWSDDSSATSAPSAFLYGGWYSPFNYVDVFDWLPGSVGVDLNSFSLIHSDLRTGATYWGPRALDNGLSCVAGVLDEPYINGHARSHVLLYYLLRGYCFAEAAMLSTPTVEWKCVNIGDPLYNPMRRGKPLSQDTSSPVMATNYPYLSLGAGSNDWVVHVTADDSINPEVMLVDIDYGTTTNYGNTASQGRAGYYRRQHVTLTNLLQGTTYHFRVTMTDPVGNVTVTSNYTFNTTNVAPQITSSPVSNGTVAVAYVYQAAATGSPKPLWRLTQAPPGMAVDHLTGTVTWTPDDGGDFNVTLRADNGVAPEAVQSWTIDVFDPDDVDGDGIPNAWEQLYFGGPTNAVATNDGDGDGLDNLGEYLAGTIPTNGDSYFQITEIDTVPGTDEYIMRWPSVSNRVYSVLWSTSLPGGFQCLASDLPTTPTLNSYTDTQHSAESRIFYRISVKEE